MNTAARKTLRVTAIGLGSLIVIVLVAVALFDWNTLKHPIERIASAKTGRTISIGGKLQVHIWSWTPTVIVNGLTVGNPPWESARPMATVDRLEIHLKLLPLLKGDVILPRVALFSPNVYLHQDKGGRANWTFENKAPTNAPATKPSKIPAVRDLLIQDGKLTLIDEMRRLKLNGSIQAHEQKSASDPTPFRIQGSGTINEQPFELRVAGGPLLNLDPEHAYAFDLHIVAGNLHADSKGRALKPFDLGQLDFEVDVSGKDLAEGFYLTQLALPNTAPFKLHAHIARNDMKVAVSDIAGTVGESDLRGKLDIDASRKRPYMRGDLVSKQLRMKDLAASLGGQPKGADSLDAKAPAQQPNKSTVPVKAPRTDPNTRLFPDAHLQVDRVRAMDADVKFRATSIDAGSVPFKEIAFRVRLDEGVLSLDPFAFEMPQGQLSGQARIDARKKIPTVHIDVRIKDIQLEQLKSKKPGASAPLVGVMQARAVIDGTGDSVHQVMSDANGRFTLILPDGQVTSAFAELTGINVFKGLGLLLTKSDEKAPIRCGVAQFKIDEGLMNAENITFDTQDVLIKGSGNINLGPEELHLEIKGEPKKIRFTRLRTPIEIRGHLADPSFGVNVASAAKQGAVAVALGVLATPVAAIIAFVDPGLAKDQNCAAMIAEADRKGPEPPQSAIPSPNRAAQHPTPAPTVHPRPNESLH
jgi:AsmA family protein